jgi:CO/xanthine dehydrogenase FAD-binding subunit
MPIKAYFLPQSLDEAVSLLGEHGPDLLVLSGGTITMPHINEGLLLPEMVMGLRQTGLNYVRVNGEITLGATATLNQVLTAEASSLLSQATRSAAAGSVRNMATIGGNIFAPAPYGDVTTALLALQATLKLVNSNGERFISLAEFLAEGRSLTPGELLAEIQVPRPTGRTAYHKFGRKTHNTPAVVTVAAHLVLADETVTEATIALNGAAEQPIRATAAEAALTGQPLTEASITAAAQAAVEAATPPTDAIASSWYRQRMVGAMVKRTLTQLLAQEA